MAARRIRIKGVANIPQRRKPGNVSDNSDQKDLNNYEESKLLANTLQDVEEKKVVPLVEEIKTSPDTLVNRDVGTDGPLATLNPVSDKSCPQICSEDVKEKTTREQAIVTPKVVHFSFPDANSDGSVPVHNRLKLDHVTEQAGLSSDTEYPQPPPSPTKINRTRIRPTPRLGQRRTSFSASESEDDNRKSYGRHRNDSVCSVASGILESQCTVEPSSPKKEFNTVIQRKWRRSEQTRKLAEARREFSSKFKGGVPDRQKLTMMDLIFYNPTTNPMSNKRKRKDTLTKKDIDEPEENPVLEEEPEPVQSEDESGIPAPQIKIGPDGQIVVDEKSLVIENKEVKRNQEAIQKSALIDGDIIGKYGVYKRPVRPKEWTKHETLIFYKALNTIGTDFTLMNEIFPNRSRRELKMKFKKEERMNKALIDRAIMHPINYNILELKHEVEAERRVLAEKEKLRLQRSQKQKLKKIPKRKRSSYMANEMNDYSPRVNHPVNRKSDKKETKISAQKAINCGIESFLDDSDADDESGASSNEAAPEEDEDSNSDESECIIPDPQPTRSGRIPKPRNLDIEQRLAPYTRRTMKYQSPKSDDVHLEPGSVVIFPGVGPAGEVVYKVFMVTPGQDKTPIDLDADVLEALTRNATNFGPLCAENLLTISAHENEGTIPENNITIPASENGDLANEINITIPENNVTIPASDSNTSVPGNVKLSECKVTILENIVIAGASASTSSAKESNCTLAENNATIETPRSEILNDYKKECSDDVRT